MNRIEGCPGTCAIIHIGNCIKHHECTYFPFKKKTDRRESHWDFGFRKFCELSQPWMQGKDVVPPLTEFIEGNHLNLSTVARAKNQVIKEIRNELAKNQKAYL